jgi:hypothetical protein
LTRYSQSGYTTSTPRSTQQMNPLQGPNQCDGPLLDVQVSKEETCLHGHDHPSRRREDCHSHLRQAPDTIPVHSSQLLSPTRSPDWPHLWPNPTDLPTMLPQQGHRQRTTLFHTHLLNRGYTSNELLPLFRKGSNHPIFYLSQTPEQRMQSRRLRSGSWINKYSSISPTAPKIPHLDLSKIFGKTWSTHRQARRTSTS